MGRGGTTTLQFDVVDGIRRLGHEDEGQGGKTKDKVESGGYDRFATVSEDSTATKTKDKVAV